MGVALGLADIDGIPEGLEVFPANDLVLSQAPSLLLEFDPEVDAGPG